MRVIVAAAEPEVIIHQMTALTSMKSFRNGRDGFPVRSGAFTSGKAA